MIEMEKETKKRLPVSEIFYSIQGEGQTMGIPAVFLRLGGCNLLCESKSWVCDTIEVWRKSKSIPFENVLSNDLIMHLRLGAHLVITGGEPLIHQKEIVEFLSYLIHKHSFVPIVEIETNGTIMPQPNMNYFVDFWNVSPKLTSAGKQNSWGKRFNLDALRFFNSEKQKTIYKFVIADESDIDELTRDFVPHIITKQIVLMPAGSSQEELNNTRLFVAQKSIELGYRYSDRLHVVIWNQKTGV